MKNIVLVTRRLLSKKPGFNAWLPDLVKFEFLFILILTMGSSQYCMSQNVADSLHSLIKKSKGVRKGELNLLLADHYMNYNTDSVIYYSQKTIKIGQDNSNPVLIIRSYARIGEAYQKKNEIDQAITFYLKGLKLAEKHNETSLAGSIYNGIGVCYFYKNNIPKAEEYIKLAAQAKKDAGDYQHYALISANLGILQLSNKSYSEALNTLKAVKKKLENKNQLQYLPTVYNAIGAVYQVIKPDSCIYYYEKSANTGLKFNDLVTVMSSYQNIGDYYLEKQDYDKAVVYMQKAIKVNDTRPEDDFKPALYDRMSILYSTTGDFKNAYHFKKLENESRQRLASVQRQKEADELEVRYQSEKKGKEIELHKKEIEKGKNQRNFILFASLILIITGIFITYLIFQRKKITQRFEQEKLKLFENIVHEIKTPLTLIQGPIELMKNNPESNNEEQIIFLERNAKKLYILVEELLDASKLGKGTYSLHYLNGNICVYIDDIVTNFVPEAQAKDINVTSQKNFEDLFCTFPSNAVDKIISNLLGNAIKYSPVGAEVKVISEIHEDRLNIKITDEGGGIPVKEQGKIFRRFYRGTSTVNVNGTGIGLSLVKELIELVNGTIHLESGNHGTMFTVEIPIQKNNLQYDTPPGQENKPVLLLVEDDNDTAGFTTSVLKENFRIRHSRNGNEALTIINEELPDIVLSDVMMPEKDGIELLKEIRENELFRHLPVILFSAQASLESRLKGLSNGANAYIAKPFSPEEIKLTINNLFATLNDNRNAYRQSLKVSENSVLFHERVKSDNAYVNKVIQFIIDNIDNHEYSVNELSDDMSVSRSQLHRKLSTLTGFSTTNFIRMVRLEKAKDLLLSCEGNVSEIAYKCGFSSQSYFTRSFTEYFGKSPSQMIKYQ